MKTLDKKSSRHSHCPDNEPRSAHNDSVKARLDRVVVDSWAKHPAKPPILKGFRCVRDSFVRCQTTVKTYARRRQYQSLTNDTKIFWQYDRQRNWWKRWRITIIGDDNTGLTYNELNVVTSHCRYWRFLIIEVAFDFSPETGVDERFVRRHGRFGKSHRREKQKQA